MLTRHLMERPDDRAIEQAPDALYAVRVNVATDPLVFAVVDSLVLVAAARC